MMALPVFENTYQMGNVIFHFAKGKEYVKNSVKNEN